MFALHRISDTLLPLLHYTYTHTPHCQTQYTHGYWGSCDTFKNYTVPMVSFVMLKSLHVQMVMNCNWCQHAGSRIHRNKNVRLRSEIRWPDRHGNKGVVPRTMFPVEDMPYLPDGTQSISCWTLLKSSRMNIVAMELHRYGRQRS